MDSFNKYLELHNIHLDKTTLDKFVHFEDFIRRFNRSIKLVASREVDNLWLRHFADSLSPFVEGILPSSGNFLDIGSGAGLPGIPLAIVNNEFNITMAESNQRKARFISRTIIGLSLDNARVFSERFERINGVFDIILIRAVYSDYNILSSLKRFIPISGMCIFYKGSDYAATLPDKYILDDNGFSEARIIRPSGLSGESVLVVFYKVR